MNSDDSQGIMSQLQWIDDYLLDRRSGYTRWYLRVHGRYIMRTIRTAFLAGVGALMLSGALSAAAADQDIHVMTVRLPDGAVEQIRYSGDVPPQIVIANGATPFDIGWPVGFFGPDSPFAEMDHISAEIGQMTAMIRNADALAANPGVAEIDAGKLPPGAESYSFVSTMSGNGVCARSVQITSRGEGQKPQVLSRTYGDCGKGSGGAVPGVQHAVPADQPSDMQEIRYVPRTDGGTVREASVVQY